jgi:hypothetical protein
MQCLLAERRALNESFNLLKELIQHHLGDAIQHPLSDARDDSADFGIAAVLEQGLAIFFLKIDGHIGLHKARSARALPAQNVMRWSLLVFYGDFSLVASLDRSNANLQRRFISVRADFGQLFTARHALGHDLWIQQDLPDPLSGRVKRVSTFYLQTFLRYAQQRA